MNDTLPAPDKHAAHRRPLPAGAPVAVSRYDVLRVLGEGTFGRVYLAFDPQIGRYVAVKVPRDPLPPELHANFLREARATADIHHPNLCPVYDAGTHEKTPFIVMRCVGATLDEVLSGPPIDAPTAVGFALQIAKGLEAAHAKGIIHRDLKPGNVLYDAASDQLLLTDFGIARWLDGTASTTGGLKGNPAHMAPEQWDPAVGEISPRTDVYSLGVLLFRMLTGVPLYAGTVAQLMRAHLEQPPRRPTDVRPDLDPRCDAVCAQALAKEPDKRFASATEFAAALAALLAPPPSNAGAKWTVGVPGMWYARGASAPPGAKWEISTPTPGPVPCEPNRAYRLEASPQADDRDLATLSYLKGFLALTRLDLNGCEQLTDASLSAVGSLASLRTLHLRWCKQLTDAALAALAPLAELRALDLRGCKQITDAGAKHLRAFAQLEALDVMFCNQLTDAALAHCAALRQLRTLNLSECFQVTDAGLAALAPLKELRVLHLNWCLQLTDAGLAALAALPNLAELSVQGCPQLTDSGLSVLAGAPNLRWLHVGACDGITASGRDALQAAKPKLKIER